MKKQGNKDDEARLKKRDEEKSVKHFDSDPDKDKILKKLFIKNKDDNENSVGPSSDSDSGRDKTLKKIFIKNKLENENQDKRNNSTKNFPNLLSDLNLSSSDGNINNFVLDLYNFALKIVYLKDIKACT